jgi:ribosome biogenesis GTPase A
MSSSKNKDLINSEYAPQLMKGHIHWYPGHIAKAEKALKNKLSLVDAVIEVLDARIPFSSCYNNIEGLLGEKPRLVLLNKIDLVEKAELSKWIEFLEKKSGCKVLTTDAKNSRSLSSVVSSAIDLSEPKIQSLMKKGLLRRAARIMVVGMPNVGKSSIINKLTKTSKTKVGAKAGVTRQQQWVRINPKLDLLDTPGIIPMKQENQDVAVRLACVNSVSENAYEKEIIAKDLLDILKLHYSEKVKAYYNLGADDNLSVENIAKSRNWITSGAEPDIQRASASILNDFRDGQIGKFILDELEV